MYKNKKKSYKMMLVLLILVAIIMMATMSCTKANPVSPYGTKQVPGELIIRLNDDIREEMFEEFILDYSRYELGHKETISDNRNTHLFSFNPKIIKDKVFLEMIRNDIRVYSAQFNFVYIPTPKIVLHGNDPNPFTDETMIIFTLVNISQLKMEIYNSKGQNVRTIVNLNDSLYVSTRDPFGEYYHAIWDGTDDSNKRVEYGKYFYRIISNAGINIGEMDFVENLKIIGGVE